MFYSFSRQYQKVTDSNHGRRDEAGIKSRELGVLFRDLRVVGLGAAVSYQPTLGSLFNPKYMLERIQNARHPPVRDILSRFDGVVRPGEMLRKSIFSTPLIHP